MSLRRWQREMDNAEATAAALSPYDLERLRKAIKLKVDRVGPNQFYVAGNEAPFYAVNLDLDTPCDCMDAQMHGRNCKHELAARFHNREMGVVMAVGEELVRAIKQLDAALEKKQRKLKLMPETK